MNKKKYLVLLITLMTLGTILILSHQETKDNAVSDNELTLEQLRALPYISYTEEKADKTKAGVTVYDKDRALEGYNLYKEHLMDMEGNIVARFKNGVGYPVLILGNGDILSGNQPTCGIGKYKCDSTPIWIKSDIKIHHEIALTHYNTILTASKEVHEYNGRRVEFDIIIELDQDGNELSRWSTWENFERIRQLHKPSTLDRSDIKLNIGKDHINNSSPFGGDYDYYHLNSIQVLPENLSGREDKRFKKGNWLISLSHLKLVLILNKDIKEIVWHWRKEKLSAIHTPRMLDNGNILIFANGGRRGYSSVIELNPITKEIVWEYKADPPESFFCKSMGSAQRLPNGNTLIGDGMNGHAFEVTKEGEIVWEWYDPKFNKEGKQETFHRMIRYPKDKIEKMKLIKHDYK